MQLQLCQHEAGLRQLTPSLTGLKNQASLLYGSDSVNSISVILFLYHFYNSQRKRCSPNINNRCYIALKKERNHSPDILMRYIKEQHNFYSIHFIE